MDNMALGKFEKMFLRQPNGFAYCKLCNKEILILDKDEVEFWRHQVDREHLDSLINFYLSQEQDRNGKRRGQSQRYEIYQAFKDRRLNNFEKYKQKEAKRMMKIQKGSNQMNQIVDQLNKLKLKNQTNDDDDEIIKKVKQNLQNRYPYETNYDNNLESALSLQQNYKKKKIDPSQEKSFQQLVEEHFNNFIVDIIKKQQFTETICFLLARIGISSTQICEIKFARIYWEIKELNRICQDLPQIILTLNVLKELVSQLEQDVGENNKGFLIKQPKKPKELRKKLENLRKTIRSETTFQDYKRFLERLKVKSLNALFKSEIKNKMHLIKRGFQQDSIGKEQDEFYIDILKEEEENGSQEAEDQSAIFEGIESNSYKEQELAQKQILIRNQSVQQQITNSKKQAYQEKVLELIREYEQDRINKKQQSMEGSNYDSFEKNSDQINQKNQEWNDQLQNVYAYNYYYHSIIFH